MTTMYVTKWCLTKGIRKLDGTISQSTAWAPQYFSSEYMFVEVRKDAFYTLDEANLDVGKRLKKARAVLEKRLTRFDQDVPFKAFTVHQ